MANMSSIRFLSLEPLQLDLLPNRESSGHDTDAGLSEKLLRLQKLDPTNTFVHSRPTRTESSILKSVIRSQVPPTSSPPITTGRRHSLSVAAASAASHSVTSAISRFCNARAVFWKGAYLKDVSAFVQQVDVRNEQARLLPDQYRAINRLVKEDLPSAAAQYINFYNCIWLILNDIIMGYTFGIFLRENSEILGHLGSEYTEFLTIQLVRDSLMWLDDWPAGLKLNTELSHFFCMSYLGGLDVWKALFDWVSPYFPRIIYIIGLAGPLGLTMTISLISDLVSLITAPLYFSYLGATTIFRVQLSAAASLWRLFRGKRRNVLQNRTDAWDYDMDQLLLGTILFTLIAFLFPTVGVYYLFFALIRLSVVLAHAALETMLAFMNHFPLFAVMLRLKNPARLPGGIYVILEGTPPQPVVKNAPIPMSRIFFQHLRLWSNLTAHYNPLRLMRCVLTGTFITPIERYSIRYDSTTSKTSAGLNP